jgi:Protein of unknown function (DUF4019)
MKFVLGIIVAVFMFTAAPARAQDSNADKVAKAEVAALTWLALADAGDYPGSWDQAADFVHSSISKPNWVHAVGSARQPLGSLISRKVKTATFTRSLPGVPDGEYVVIKFDTQFEHKESAVETVTPLLDKDGSWKVAGYFIK